MDSKFIIDVLSDKFSKDYMYLTEKYVFGEESDFLTFDYKDKTHEFEVKVSRSDFKADFKKRKHEYFKKILDGKLYIRSHQYEFKNYCMFSDRYIPDAIPNKFSFIVPAELIQPEEVPKYAGLYYVYEDGCMVNVKKCKTLHKEKFKLWRTVANKLFYHLKKCNEKS